MVTVHVHVHEWVPVYKKHKRGAPKFLEAIEIEYDKEFTTVYALEDACSYYHVWAEDVKRQMQADPYYVVEHHYVNTTYA